MANSDTEHGVAAATYTIKSTSGKGKGMFATRNIAVATCIIAEAPIFKLSNCPWNVSQEIIAAKLRQRSKDEQRAYFSLYNRFPRHPKPIVGIAATNALGLHSEPDTHGVFLQCSRINHCCVANAYREYSPDCGQMLVYATRNILPDEEITICYEHETGPLRRKMLLQDWGFVCACDLCKSPADIRAASDARVARFYELEDTVLGSQYTLRHPTNALHMIHEMFGLLMDEGITDVRVAKVYMLAYHVTIMHSDLVRAAWFARWAFITLRKCTGVCGPDVQKWNQRISDPRRSPCFGWSRKWADERSDFEIPDDVVQGGVEAYVWRLEDATDDAGNSDTCVEISDESTYASTPSSDGSGSGGSSCSEIPRGSYEPLADICQQVFTLMSQYRGEQVENP